MLKQRILTALALLAILLPAIFYPDPTAFSLVAAVMVAAAAWEWARLNQFAGVGAWTSGVVGFAMCIGLWVWKPSGLGLWYVWLISAAAWVLSSAWVLTNGAQAWGALSKWVRLLGGLFALSIAWLAITQARERGLGFLLSILVIVWGADVFAYFAGRGLGGRFFKRKLAPTVSPGKTWEGVIGGFLGVLLIASVWAYSQPNIAVESLSLFGLLHRRGDAVLLLGVAFLVAMSVVGDLVESLFKRSAGVKDSSGLLPGHGGVLDRIDALLPVLPLAMMIAAI